MYVKQLWSFKQWIRRRVQTQQKGEGEPGNEVWRGVRASDQVDDGGQEEEQPAQPAEAEWAQGGEEEGTCPCLGFWEVSCGHIAAASFRYD